MLISLLFLILPFAPDRCVTAEIRLNSSVVATGTPVGIGTLLTNCGNKRANFKVLITVSNECGEVAVIADTDPGDGTIMPGGALGFNRAFQAGQCLGTHTVKVEVSSSNGGKVLTTATNTFEVEEP